MHEKTCTYCFKTFVTAKYQIRICPHHDRNEIALWRRRLRGRNVNRRFETTVPWVRAKNTEAVTPMQLQHMTPEKFVQFTNQILDGTVNLGRLNAITQSR